MGVGPGDPQLMTLRAVDTVRSADCVVWVATGPARSRARDTASAWIPEAARTFEFLLPMKLDPGPAERVYDAAAEQIGATLRLGQNVVCLCEGDPLFYGSFMYLHARLHKNYSVRIVPGIPSTSAAAAALGTPLAAREDRLAVIPASNDDATIEAAAMEFETVAFLKVGRHLPRLRSILEACGVARQAALVENASLAGEAIYPLLDAPESASYFSMVLLRQGKAGEL